MPDESPSPARLTLRLDFGPAGQLGPGKVRLLEEIARCGSISAAGRALGMSYRRAWLLVDEVNRTFREPAVTTQMGGSGGGGAALTAWGGQLIRLYRETERLARSGAAAPIGEMEGHLSGAPSGAAIAQADEMDG